MISINRASQHDVDAFAGRLRPDDAAEVEAFGVSQRDGLRTSLDASLSAWAAYDDGEPVAIWGVAAADIMGGVGRPWLLTTGAVERNKRAFMVTSRNLWRLMRPLFPRWENWVDARYSRSLRWLTWLGFTIGEAQPIGPHGQLFHHVTAEG